MNPEALLRIPAAHGNWRRSGGGGAWPSPARGRGFDAPRVDDGEGFRKRRRTPPARRFPRIGSERFSGWTRTRTRKQAPRFTKPQLKSPIGENNCQENPHTKHKIGIGQERKERVFMRVSADILDLKPWKAGDRCCSKWKYFLHLFSPIGENKCWRDADCRWWLAGAARGGGPGSG